MCNYYVTHAVCASKITYHAWACNNVEFTFQLMTAGLLNTKEFQNLKYCIRSKAILDHLEAFLYPTVHEISVGVRFVVKLQIPMVSASTHVEQCDFFIIMVYKVRIEMLCLLQNTHIRNLQWGRLIHDQRYW